VKILTKLLAAAAASFAVATQAQALELLNNGDFDAGNVGFYSAYSFAVDHNLWPEAAYDVARNPAWTHGRFVSMADHTPGSDYGRMMVVNGASVADTVIWAQGDIGGGASLGGAADSAFTFSFWMASVYSASPANLQLWVNGAKVRGVTFAATADLGLWRQYSYSGVASGQGLHSIGLTNNNLAPNGNDFALDDMSLLAERAPLPPPFEPEAKNPPMIEPPPGLELPPVLESQAGAPLDSGVPEPSTWAMLILGFGLMGSVLRRRSAPATRLVC